MHTEQSPKPVIDYAGPVTVPAAPKSARAAGTVLAHIAVFANCYALMSWALVTLVYGQHNQLKPPTTAANVAAVLGDIGLIIGLIGIGLGVVAVVRRPSSLYATFSLLLGISYWCWIFSIAFGRF